MHATAHTPGTDAAVGLIAAEHKAKAKYTFHAPVGRPAIVDADQ